MTYVHGQCSRCSWYDPVNTIVIFPSMKDTSRTTDPGRKLELKDAVLEYRSLQLLFMMFKRRAMQCHTVGTFLLGVCSIFASMYICTRLIYHFGWVEKLQSLGWRPQGRRQCLNLRRQSYAMQCSILQGCNSPYGDVLSLQELNAQNLQCTHYQWRH